MHLKHGASCQFIVVTPDMACDTVMMGAGTASGAAEESCSVIAAECTQAKLAVSAIAVVMCAACSWL